MKNATSIFISTLFLFIKEDDDTPSPPTDALDLWENTFRRRARSSDSTDGTLIQDTYTAQTPRLIPSSTHIETARRTLRAELLGSRGAYAPVQQNANEE